jgi:drug/metabolite transporter (DMT)-like permease
MTYPIWLWTVFTLAAAVAQTLRNATQLNLTGRLGVAGATSVRFLFAWPFVIVALVVVSLLEGRFIQPTLPSLYWTALGALAQISATALMLQAMQERSFVVVTAYTKTEPLQLALFALVFLGEQISAILVAAILIAILGVMILSWPSGSGPKSFSLRPALLGLASGGLFALAAVGFRGGIAAIEATSFVAAAATTLAVTLTIQVFVLNCWLLLQEPETFAAVRRVWRKSFSAGALGAFASLNWFLAFALTNPAKVRTLGLIEVVIAGFLSRWRFGQSLTAREIVGMILAVAGILLLLQS